jgi:phenylacetic acid degradation operon negative regulatory protein
VNVGTSSPQVGQRHHSNDEWSSWAPDSSQSPTIPVGSARSLLYAILGELVLPYGDAVWTVPLLYVMRGMGIEEAAARQALSRVVEAGLIVGTKHGRAVRLTVPDEGKAHIDAIRRRSATLIDPPRRWDGRCLIAAITVPQRLRGIRRRLYSELHWQGFGNPAPGIWTSPHLDRADELRSLIDKFDLNDTTVTFIGKSLGIGLTDSEIVDRAWDLRHIEARYQDTINTFTGLEPTSDDGLLLAYIALVREFAELSSLDPQLPEDLLPDWIGHRATRLFVDLKANWSARAHARWREIVRDMTPESSFEPGNG